MEEINVGNSLLLLIAFSCLITQERAGQGMQYFICHDVDFSPFLFVF